MVLVVGKSGARGHPTSDRVVTATIYQAQLKVKPHDIGYGVDLAKEGA